MIFFVQQVSADSTFVSSSVDRNEMRPGDTFTLSLTIESEGSIDLGQPEWPNFSGFQIVNTWTESQMRSVFENNKLITKRKQLHHMQLQAQREGRFTLPPIRINVDGSFVSTKPISIQVSKNVAQTRPPSRDEADSFGFGGIDDMFNQMFQDSLKRFRQPRQEALPDKVNPNLNTEELIFISSEVDKKNLYVGEQLTASFYLYSRGQISDIDTLEYPTLAGFWKEDIEVATRLKFKPIQVNGVSYQRALLASYALFPIKEGTAKVDSYKAKLNLVNFNVFGRSQVRSIIKSSEPIKIKVKALPVAGRPDSFTGTVGDFKLKTTLDNKKPKLNQPMTLTLRFEGRGNAKLIDIPDPEFPPGLELYDTQSESAFYSNGVSFKEFRLLLIPRQPGEITLTSFPTFFFNPEKKEYYRLNSEEFVLNITGSLNQTGVKSSQQPLGSGTIETSTKKLPPLILKYERGVFLKQSYKYIFWGVLYFFSVFGLIGLAYLKFGKKEKREKLKNLVHKRMQKIEKLFEAENISEMASETVNLIYFTLGELSDIGGASEELEKMLLKAPPSFRMQNQKKLVQLMKVFETLAFAPKEMLVGINNKRSIKNNINEVKNILIEATRLDFSDEI